MRAINKMSKKEALTTLVKVAKLQQKLLAKLASTDKLVDDFLDTLYHLTETEREFNIRREALKDRLEEYHERIPKDEIPWQHYAKNRPMEIDPACIKANEAYDEVKTVLGYWGKKRNILLKQAKKEGKEDLLRNLEKNGTPKCNCERQGRAWQADVKDWWEYPELQDPENPVTGPVRNNLK